MGVDLTLLIVDGNCSANSGYSHTMIEFRGFRDMYHAIENSGRCYPRPGWNLSAYLSRDETTENSCYGTVSKTPYGLPLTYIQAGDFCELVAAFDLNPWAKAAVAFLKELPPDTHVGLYWH